MERRVLAYKNTMWILLIPQKMPRKEIILAKRLRNESYNEKRK